MSQARSLQFENTIQVVEEINRLRKGYQKAGNWSLEQICWHLAETIVYRMKPGPHPANTPEQDGRQEAFKTILATRKLPGNIVAPDPLVPPVNPGDEAIDSLIKALDQFDNYHGAMTPHRLFGNMTETQAKQLNLIHCAHHLSHLIPT